MPRTTTAAAGAALLAFTATLLLGGADAAAGCGGVKHAAAVTRGADGRAPLAIGDSVLLGAVPQVAAAGFEVNTRGCRQMREGLQVIAARKRAKTLPRLVVIVLGTNGDIRMSDIRAAMELVGRERVLGLVTPRELGGGSGSDARVVRAAGRRYPERVRVLDWVRLSAGRSGWFAGDGIHLGRSGASGLARLLRGALPFATAPLCP
ncbi:MAG: hypothetical protein QOJ89_656 [bacterium]